MAAFYIRRVLVADGNAPDLAVTKLSLQEYGRWHVVAVASGADAVRAASRERVDVAVIADELADMTGEAALAQLRAAPETAGLPVVMLTALRAGARAEAADRWFALGARGILGKPVSSQELPEQLRKQVGAEAGAPPEVLFRGK